MPVCSAAVSFVSPCIFQRPCPHTADLLTAFPPCCLFSFDPILFIFTPLRDSFLFCSELVRSFYSLFSYLDIFSPMFLSSFFRLARLHLLPLSPVFHFSFAFLQTHRPFISLLVLSSALLDLFVSSCHL